MAWNEQRIESLEEFVCTIASLSFTTSDEHRYWFRGQSNTQWPLKPSLLRGVAFPNVEMEDLRAIEHLALKAFRSQAHMFVSAPLLAKVHTIPCWWSLMQHHDAPTRLLDWSASPYVAAYFAAHHEGEESDGVVWCFCSKRLRIAAEQVCGKPPAFEEDTAPTWYQDALENPKTSDVVMPLEFNFVSSERCAAQQGKFTMALRAGVPHDGIIGHVANGYARKFIIPADAKSKFLLRLREMNITGAALFPGVDGLGRSVKELVSLGKLCHHLDPDDNKFAESHCQHRAVDEEESREGPDGVRT